jgi:hypothetical protein
MEDAPRAKNPNRVKNPKVVFGPELEKVTAMYRKKVPLKVILDCMDEESVQDNPHASFLKAIVRYFIEKIRQGEVSLADFDHEYVKHEPMFNPLHQALLLGQVEEIKMCTIVHQKIAFNIGEVRQTYLGSKMIESLKWEPKNKITKEELDVLVSGLKQIGVDVKIIEDFTTTEKYFDNKRYVKSDLKFFTEE